MALRSGFSPARAFPEGSAGVAAVLRTLGYAQIDTISVVERAHHHTFSSRVPTYTERDLVALELPSAGGRLAFEYWAHAAAYLPIEDYRYCLPRMRRVRERGHEWFSVEPIVVAGVLERIREEGPLSAKDFEDPRPKAGSWWAWKPAKRALEYLFHGGYILASTRRGFVKVFDLAERVLPDQQDLAAPDDAEMAAWYLERTAATHGVFADDEIAYGRRDSLILIPDALAARLEGGELRRVSIEGLDLGGIYATQDALNGTGGPWVGGRPSEGAQPGGAGPVRAVILSPFDPFVINRKRLRRLFGVDYTVECYVPEAKRRFGYFALPILAYRRDESGAPTDGTVVGLLDAKADRKSKTLILKRLELSEASLFDGLEDELLIAVVAAIRERAAALGCADFETLRVDACPALSRIINGRPGYRNAETLARAFARRYFS